MPVGTALLIVGVSGLSLLQPDGPMAAADQIAGGVFSAATLYVLCLVPLLNLFAQLAGVSGLTGDAWAVTSRRTFDPDTPPSPDIPRAPASPSLPVAALFSCASCATLLGSSLATGASLGATVLADLRRAGHDPMIASGAIAAGAACGHLLAPTIALIVYSVLAAQPVEALLMAVLVPGVLVLLATAVVLRFRSLQGTRRRDGLPVAPVAGHFGPVWMPLLRMLPLATIALMVYGAVWTGWVDLVEAMVLGIVAAMLLMLWRGKGVSRAFLEVLVQTLRASAPTFWLLIGAFAFLPFVSQSGLPETISDWALDTPHAPLLLLLAVFAALFVVGMFMDSLSTLVLVMPVVLPALQLLGIDLLWLGVAVILVLELGLLAPPFGILLFVVKALLPTVNSRDIMVSILPLWLTMLMAVLVLMAFPSLATWLPGTMRGL